MEVEEEVEVEVEVRVGVRNAEVSDSVHDDHCDISTSQTTQTERGRTSM